MIRKIPLIAKERDLFFTGVENEFRIHEDVAPPKRVVQQERPKRPPVARGIRFELLRKQRLLVTKKLTTVEHK